jgi:hypothetical protein
VSCSMAALHAAGRALTVAVDVWPPGCVCRVLEVCDRVKGALGPDTDCTITPAPADSLAAGSTTSTALGRKACKDVTSSA